MISAPNNKKNISDILEISSLPSLETEILISFLIKKSREFILTHPATSLSQATYKKFRAWEKKRRAHWPIAYLVGHKEFYGLDFKVNPATLVPRPETEMVVEQIISNIKTLKTDGQNRPSIVDIGTGSGAIIIAAAAEIRRLFPVDFSKINFLATDISAAALKIARQNAKTYQLNNKINFRRGNLLAPLKLKNSQSNKENLIIAANLPYLTPGQIKKAPSINREPRLALDGGDDGLKYYRQLFQQLQALNIQSADVLCEIDPGQIKKITFMALKYFPESKNLVLKDYRGQTRLFIIKIRF